MEAEIHQARAVDGVTIAWASVGSGPALIHMPGVPFSDFVAEWRIPILRRAYEDLAGSVRLIQYDARGSGRSQRDVGDLSLEAMLADLDAVVAAAGVERFSLLGFFHSVLLSIIYAARHPDRVTSLVLFGGSVRGWSLMRGTSTQALLSLIERDWDTFVESATHAWLGWPDQPTGSLAADWFRTATTPAVARQTMQVISGVDVSAEAAQVRCPALVLHRRDAPVVPIELSEELAAALPKGRLRVVDGSSASLFFERPERMVAEIVDFVTEVGSPSGTAPGPGSQPRTRSRARLDRPDGLTPREIDVLRLVAAGETNAEIAARLGLSVHTVERHAVNLYRKIDARGRADATAYAVRRGIA
jgi:pimeloyl-ACP methyl ester carboxylesterase/DNA-binding CsgD family transcriptional regulator